MIGCFDPRCRTVMGMLLAVLLAGVVLPSQAVCADSPWDNLLKSLKEVLPSGGLSESVIAKGLKEALEVGTRNAVSQVSSLDGYYRNPDIRIPLPAEVKKAEELMRTFGLGDQLDAFVLSMNRAAETAAPEARGIFVDAIFEMGIDDARRILEGSDNEATLYFRERTGDRLTTAFLPMAHDAMAEVGVTRIWQNIETRMETIPFLAESFRFDLDRYVTEKALDGLFLELAEEEKKIRTDPAARVTELLEKVFGRSEK
ncbi:MAG: DUF4197 domain-containing protein [Desulfobacterales bacterium]|nr:DUF4197 domain-containing protein [Desulfobacterales bacterium]